jgi:5,10-methylenetetrahydrofolate reductase
MRIVDYFDSGRPVFSFEFFPPKTDEGVRALFSTVKDLARLSAEASASWGSATGCTGCATHGRRC